MDDLRRATSALTVEWARLLAPHFGPSGSMDLDLRDWPKAEGPSYYNQFSHFVFLQLATGEVPGATPAEQAEYLGLALRNLEYALAITAADFHTPHFSRGREWGRHVGEWLNYYLLCSLELLERHQLGSADLRARLGRAVAGAVGVLHGRFVAKYAATPQEFVGNHDTWHGLLFFRAGRHFQRADWMDYARGFFARCVLPFQTADGYWPEGHGIVVGYSLVTAEAVSLYAELAGDRAAQAAIGRFLGFYDFFSFPDGTTAVAADVRMRYSRMPFMFLPPGFLDGAVGRQLVLARLEAARRYFQAAGVHDNGAQSFTFFGSFAEFVFKPRGRPPELELQRPATLPAARLARGDWHAFLGWQVTPEHPSRFVLDSQNFVEVWHRTAGYLAGTGGSKFMPRFSTLRRTDDGRAYLPDRVGDVRQTAGEAAVRFGFGPDEVEVTLDVQDGDCRVGARLTRAAVAAHYEAALILAFQPGESVTLDGETLKLEPSVLVHFNGGGRPLREMRWRGLVWRLPAGAVLDYPIVPHNSYTQDGLPAPADYVGRLSFPLATDAKVVVIG
jgi:hypothetical protein